MFEHILKLFTEEPEKLKKAFIKCVQLFNSLLLSFWLYKTFIGNFELLNIKDYSSIIKFFTTGKVLISLFVFSIAYYILDFMVSFVISIATLCFNWLFKWFKADDREIQNMLEFFNVVVNDNEEKRIVKGKHFDLVYQILRELNQESTITEIREFISFKYKSIFVSSTLIYFFVLPKELSNHHLNWVIPTIAVLIILLEILIEKIFEYLIKNRNNFNSGFDFIMINQVVYETLNNLRVVENPIASASLKKGFMFNLNSNSYRIMYIPFGELPIQEITERLIYFSQKSPLYILLIKAELYEKIKTQPEIEKIIDCLIIFDTGENLKDKLYEYIYSLNKKAQIPSQFD